MIIESSVTTASASVAGRDNSGGGLTGFVFALFFVFGGITSLNDVLVPKLKGLFTLSYADAMLVQFAFFAAYFTMSIPAAKLVGRLGYMRTAVVGLLLMMTGSLLFVPASLSGMFPTFLFALFVLATGVTTVQVVANPLISLLGSASSAHSRLTFAQAFNSLGTTVFPYVGSLLILGSLTQIDVGTLSGPALDHYRGEESRVIAYAYLGLAAAIATLAAVVWRKRKQLHDDHVPATGLLRSFGLLRQPRFACGTLCIFLYVGAEVTIGSFIVSYLMQPEVLGLAEQAAGKHVPLYWGGAMLGRFVGAWLLRRFAAGKVLAAAAAMVITLLLVSANTHGVISGWSLLAIGLFNSIMFPTIFALASEGLGARAAEGSGVICMAIVGGALVPLLSGFIADQSGLKLALSIPGLCYAFILAFGWYARRSAISEAEALA